MLACSMSCFSVASERPSRSFSDPRVIAIWYGCRSYWRFGCAENSFPTRLEQERGLSKTKTCLAEALFGIVTANKEVNEEAYTSTSWNILIKYYCRSLGINTAFASGTKSSKQKFANASMAAMASAKCKTKVSRSTRDGIKRNGSLGGLEHKSRCHYIDKLSLRARSRSARSFSTDCERMQSLKCLAIVEIMSSLTPIELPFLLIPTLTQDENLMTH